MSFFLLAILTAACSSPQFVASRELKGLKKHLEQLGDFDDPKADLKDILNKPEQLNEFLAKSEDDVEHIDKLGDQLSKMADEPIRRIKDELLQLRQEIAELKELKKSNIQETGMHLFDKVFVPIVHVMTFVADIIEYYTFIEGKYYVNPEHQETTHLLRLIAQRLGVFPQDSASIQQHSQDINAEATV